MSAKSLSIYSVRANISLYLFVMLFYIVFAALDTSLAESIPQRRITGDISKTGNGQIVWETSQGAFLTQTVRGQDNSSWCAIHGQNTNAVVLLLKFSHNDLVSISTGPEFAKMDFALDDFDGDKKIDFVQLINKDNSVWRAFTINSGLVEPLPSDLYLKNREQFYKNHPKLNRYLQELKSRKHEAEARSQQ